MFSIRYVLCFARFVYFVVQSRKQLLEAATRVGDSSAELIRELNLVGSTTDSARAYQEALLSLAKNVASSTANLVLQVKEAALTCAETDPALHDRVVLAARRCALATSQLVSCARVVVPTVVYNPAGQKQMQISARLVSFPLLFSSFSLIFFCSRFVVPFMYRTRMDNTGDYLGAFLSVAETCSCFEFFILFTQKCRVATVLGVLKLHITV